MTSSLSSIQPNLRDLNFEMSPVAGRLVSLEDQLLGLRAECPVSSELQLVCFCCNVHAQWSLPCSPIAQLCMKTGEKWEKVEGNVEVCRRAVGRSKCEPLIEPYVWQWVCSKISGVTKFKLTLSPVRQASASE